jgi:hypothetical protein
VWAVLWVRMERPDQLTDLLIIIAGIAAWNRRNADGVSSLEGAPTLESTFTAAAVPVRCSAAQHLCCHYLSCLFSATVAAVG